MRIELGKFADNNEETKQTGLLKRKGEESFIFLNHYSLLFRFFMLSCVTVADLRFFLGGGALLRNGVIDW